MLTIHWLDIENFAAVTRARVEPQETGATVVYGPNEAGKSTLAKAYQLLLNGVSTKTTKQDVQALRPVGTRENPKVSAELTVGSYRLRIEKRFLTGKHDCLLKILEPKVENLSGRQAEERFHDILAEEVDLSLHSALTVEQGRSLETFSASAVESLQQELAQGVGAASSSASGRDVLDQAASLGISASNNPALVEAITKTYGEYFTGKGKERGPLVDARKQEADAGERVRQARAELREAQDNIDALSRLDAELAEIGRSLPEIEAARDELRDKVKEVNAAKHNLELLQQNSSRAETEHELKTAEWQARRELIADIDTAEKNLAELEAQANAAREAKTRAEEQRQERQRTLEALDAERGVAAQVGAAAQLIEEQRAAAEKIQTQHALIAESTELEDLVARGRREVADNPATPARVKAFHEAWSALKVAEEHRNSAATTVEVEGPQGKTMSIDGSEDIALGGEPTRLRVTRRRTLSLGEYRVTLSPAHDLDQQERRVRDATKALADISAQLQVDHGDKSAVERKSHSRDDAERRVHATELKLSAVTSGRDSGQLRRELNNLERDFDERHAGILAASQRLEQSLSGLIRKDGDDRPSQWQCVVQVRDLVAHYVQAVEVTTAQVASVLRDANAEQLRGEAQRWEEETVRTVRDWSDTEDDFTVALERATETHTRLESARENVELRRERLVREREKISDDALRAEVEARAGEMARAMVVLQETQRNYEQLQPDSVTARYQAAEAKVASALKRQEVTRSNAAEIRGALGRQHGAEHALNEAQGAHEEAQRTLAAVERRANAAKLLFTTVMEAKAEVQARYEKPLRAKLESFGRIVFGTDVAFEFDDKLNVSERVSGGIELKTDQLSGGATEQLHLLTRLAVASLVGGGGSVPMIIDDALGFSDAGRNEAMNAVLGQLAKEHQLIILTCDASRFGAIAGAEMLPIETVKTAGKAQM